VFHAGKSVPARVIRGDNPEAHALVGESVDVLKMLLLVGRSVIIRIGNERRAVLPPAIVYVPRNTEIEIVSGSLGTEDRLVFFHPKYIHDSLDWNTVFCLSDSNPDAYFLSQFSGGQGAHERIYTLEPGVCRMIGELLDRMEKTLATQEDEYWPCRSRSFLLQALIIGAQLRERRSPSDRACSIPIPETELLPIQICLLQNLHNKISVDEIASYFNTNRTTLQTKFRELTGKSVLQYLITVRIQTAEILLRNTALTVAEVAERTGFSDEASFVRAFRKHSSLPPGEFRKLFVFPAYLCGT